MDEGWKKKKEGGREGEGSWRRKIPGMDEAF
jgi:hypothetical protein